MKSGLLLGSILIKMMKSPQRFKANMQVTHEQSLFCPLVYGYGFSLESLLLLFLCIYYSYLIVYLWLNTNKLMYLSLFIVFIPCYQIFPDLLILYLDAASPNCLIFLIVVAILRKKRCIIAFQTPRRLCFTFWIDPTSILIEF